MEGGGGYVNGTPCIKQVIKEDINHFEKQIKSYFLMAENNKNKNTQIDINEEVQSNTKK